MPALFTRISILLSFKVEIKDLVSDLSRRSHATAVNSTPKLVTTFFKSSSASCFELTAIIFAPNSARIDAIAKPIPLRAPVTTAVFPVKSKMP